LSKEAIVRDPTVVPNGAGNSSGRGASPSSTPVEGSGDTAVLSGGNFQQSWTTLNAVDNIFTESQYTEL